MNVNYVDERCVTYTIASALHPVAYNLNRPQYYEKYFEQEGLDDIGVYPVNQLDIPQLAVRLSSKCIGLFWPHDGKMYGLKYG